MTLLAAAIISQSPLRSEDIETLFTSIGLPRWRLAPDASPATIGGVPVYSNTALAVLHFGAVTGDERALSLSDMQALKGTQEAFKYGKYVYILSTASAPNQNLYEVVPDLANVRRTPRIEAGNVVRQVKRGQRLVGVGESADKIWAEVCLPEMQAVALGWVSKKVLREVKDAR